MAIRTLPTSSKYEIHKVDLTEGFHFGSDITYDDLLMASGPKQKHYTELSDFGTMKFAQQSKIMRQNATPFSDWVAANGGTQDIKDQFVRWRTYGEPSTETNIVFETMAAVDYPGAGGDRGTVILNNEHYKPQDILRPVRDPNAQVVLQSYGKPVTGGTEYEWVTLEEDTWINKEYFEVGQRWERMGSITSYIDGRTYGSTDFDMQYTYLEFQTGLTTFGKAYTIEEEVSRMEDLMLITMCDIDSGAVMDGKLTTKLQLEAKKSFDMEKELMMMQGRSSDHHVDKNSQKRITTSPSFFEFMEEANVIDYNPNVNNLDHMADILDNWWEDYQIPFSQRNMLFLTGSGGLKLFHDWVKERFDKEPVQVPLDFIVRNDGKSDVSDRNKYAYGNFHFYQYDLDLFGKITVAHWPMLDNRAFQGQKMTGTNKSVTSYEFIAMDMGFDKPNIKILTNEGRNRRYIEVGEWSPLGYVDSSNPVFKSVDDKDLGNRYAVKFKENFGLAIDDMSGILRFRPIPIG